VTLLKPKVSHCPVLGLSKSLSLAGVWNSSS